jgi:serine phosphatase RsbU (regulator of sigma subunit)
MRPAGGSLAIMEPHLAEPLATLADELKNFQEIVRQILPRPGEIPTLQGIDVFGDTLPLNGYIGGDHLIYVDYQKRYDLDARIKEGLAAGRSEVVANLQRCRTMAGIALLDVSGHHVTDALLAAMLHQAFLLGSLYELDTFGHITKRLFENLNSRFYHSSSQHKFVTMIYGEIAQDATFRFLSAAHPPPVVFSNKHDRFMDVSPDLCTSFPPIGIFPSNDVIDRSRTHSVLGFKDQYELNEWLLMGKGDILLLYTDGLVEHSRDGELYFPQRLEQTIRAVKHCSAKEIFQSIKSEALEFAAPSDDISIVVIKRA